MVNQFQGLVAETLGQGMLVYHIYGFDSIRLAGQAAVLSMIGHIWYFLEPFLKHFRGFLNAILLSNRERHLGSGNSPKVHHRKYLPHPMLEERLRSLFGEPL